MKTLSSHFSRIASYNNLKISEQEELTGCVIGLANGGRKLLVTSTTEDDSYSSFVIDIRKVRDCTVRKYFSNINAGGLKRHQLSHFLDSIVLHFEMKNRPSIEIEFYNHLKNPSAEAVEQERKAKYWEGLITEIQNAQLSMI